MSGRSSVRDTLSDRQQALYDRNLIAAVQAGRRAIEGELSPLLHQYIKLIESFADACERQRDGYLLTIHMLERECGMMQQALNSKIEGEKARKDVTE